MKTTLSTLELSQFTQAYKPQINYLGDELLPNQFYDSVQFAWEMIRGKDALPVMAEVSALDAEAPIRQRNDAERFEEEALYIKHKINLTEHEARAKRYGVGSQQIKELVFGDVDNLYRGVRARVEAMKMELFATGRITVKENNINKTVDYKMSSENIFAIDLTDENADVFELVEKVKDAARQKGKRVNSAIVSSRVISLLKKNKVLQEARKNSSIVVDPSEGAFMTWLRAALELQFAVYDAQYQYENADGSKSTSRFFPDDRITFLAYNGALGVGAFSPTPEDMLLNEESYRIDNLATVTEWVEKDPAAQWTKVSTTALPIIADMDNVYICYTM
jgi:hypothetical protein